MNEDKIEMLLLAYTLQEINPKEYQYILQSIEDKEPVGSMNLPMMFDAPTIEPVRYKKQCKRIIQAIKFRKEFEAERIKRTRLIRSTKKTQDF